MHSHTVAFAGLFALLFPALAISAPLPPLGPVTLEGTVATVQWVGEVKEKGIPGVSGTLGIDRTFPAHFYIELSDFKGCTADEAWGMVEAFGGRRPEKGADQLPKRLGISLQHKDPQAIKAGMKIRISGYEVMGDEGGTWTQFKKLEVLAPAQKEANAK